MHIKPISSSSQSLHGLTTRALESDRLPLPGALRRRSFLKRFGLGGAALLPAGAWLAGTDLGRADDGGREKASGRGDDEGGLTRGDTAILRFLAAAEILETDLWQQYTELALGNFAFQQALGQLDEDMATYVNQNTRDEFSHQNFLNAYLMSKGERPVNLDVFRTLPSSHATGAKSIGRLTNLMNLTVDTSWYLRYRGTGNPDFGDAFPQIVNLVNLPAIPDSDLPVGEFQIQLIANTAGFHFATIEQGGSSLYDSFLPKASSLEVIRIVAAIGGTEVMHFEVWQDKAGNAPKVVDGSNHVLFPDLPKSPDLPNPPDGTDPAEPTDTNQIFPEPCTFISPSLPPCSVIRPTSTKQGGAMAAATGLTNSGLFQGQSQAFFDFLFSLAHAADQAQRE
jgi:hypothetical protein